MYTDTSNVCWESEQEVSFYHAWWPCKTAFKNWIQIYILIQKSRNINIQLKPEVFLLGLMSKQLGKNSWNSSWNSFF